jgi:hypothetical protein
MSFTQTYVGPERCLQCHNNPGLGDATGWRSSLHANGYSYVPDDARSLEDRYGVVADYDNNGVDDFKDGLDFNTISSVFDQYKPNAPVLGYSPATGYTVTIGSWTHKVYLTYGGSGAWKQRYAVKINTSSEGETADYYISPVQYNDVTKGYAAYHPEDWWDGSNLPINYTTKMSVAAGHGHTLAKGCSGCHTTGLSLMQDLNNEWIMSGAGVENEALYTTFNNIMDIDGDGDLDQINTGCEVCHGPGGNHVASSNSADIINPANLTAEQANNLCGMCHNRGKSKPNNTFGFPFDDASLTGWSVGDFVADFFTDAGGDWPDTKTSVKHRQQYLDFIESSKPTFQFHMVTCYECHDVHNTEKNHIRTEIVEQDSTGADITVTTENDNNTLCLACHATHGDFTDIPVEWVADYDNHIADIAPIVSAHTNHSYDPTGTGESRCSKCHQPKVAKSAVNYDIHSHTFEAIAPEKTIFFVMPNSCAVSCHRDIENGSSPLWNIGVDANLGDWSEVTDIALADTLMYWYGPTGIWWSYIIPVELTTFTAVDKDGQIILNWSTATETNNQGFEVQRKSDDEEYQKIGFVAGHGTTAEIQNYSYVDSKIVSGSYTYRLKQIDFDGAFEYSAEVLVDVTTPLEYALAQNYPNPFNPTTVINYSIPEGGYVTLDVYSLLGEKVASLVNEVQEAGRYAINFDASNFASGIYVYSLKSGNFNSVKKMLLMK